MKLTDDQLHTLRHMLGINDRTKRVPEPYRNYAAVVPGDPVFLELERIGMVECYRRAGGDQTYDYYHCTEAGELAARKSFRKIRYPRARRRYIAYLRIREVRVLTFMEFLTDPEYAEVRASA